jgi:hypothetical protein
MKKIILFLSLISLSNNAFAGFAEWATTNLTPTKAKILTAYSRVCGYASGGCAWTGKKIGLYVLGADGSAIWLSTSTSAHNSLLNRYTATGGCWSYSGGNWCAQSAGFGNNYFGQLCSRSWTGSITASKVIISGSYTNPMVCNFSPTLSWPMEYNSSWFDTNVCNGSNQLSSLYETIGYSGQDTRHFATLVCNQLGTPLGTFSEFSSSTVLTAWPESYFDNAEIISTLSSGLSALNNSSTATISDLGSSIADDIAEAIDYLRNGVVTNDNISASQSFNNPFSSITPFGGYSVSVSSIYVVGASTLTVNVVSSVTVSIDLDSLSAITSTPTTILDYENALTNNWVSISSFSTDIAGSLSSLFDFTGVQAWDGCFSFAVGDVSLNGNELGVADSVFCFSSIPGWDSYALPLFKAILLIGTFLFCIFWLFE